MSNEMQYSSFCDVAHVVRLIMSNKEKKNKKNKISMTGKLSFSIRCGTTTMTISLDTLLKTISIKLTSSGPSRLRTSSFKLLLTLAPTQAANKANPGEACLSPSSNAPLLPNTPPSYKTADARRASMLSSTLAESNSSATLSATPARCSEPMPRLMQSGYTPFKFLGKRSPTSTLMPSELACTNFSLGKLLANFPMPSRLTMSHSPNLTLP